MALLAIWAPYHAVTLLSGSSTSSSDFQSVPVTVDALAFCASVFEC